MFSREVDEKTVPLHQFPIYRVKNCGKCYLVEINLIRKYLLKYYLKPKGLGKRKE